MEDGPDQKILPNRGYQRVSRWNKMIHIGLLRECPNAPLLSLIKRKAYTCNAI